MVRKLLSLNALKAFEAAARHQSFVKAAGELGVTHAAVSRHIRHLESQMRIALFERTGRGVVLTEAGAGLARDVSRGFDALASATARFTRQSRPRQKLTITCDVPFAMQWLVGRLGEFTARHPAVDIIVDPTHRLVDFAKEGVDLGIRHGQGAWPGMDAEKLADAHIIAVCSPSFQARHGVRRVRDVDGRHLIQEQDRQYWQIWLSAAGAGGDVVPSGPTLLADLAIAAAQAGQGYALSDVLTAADALAAGRLVRPFPTVVVHKGYHLVWPQGRKLSRPAQAFRSWLTERIAATLADTPPSSPRRDHGAAAASGAKRTRKPPTA